MRGFKSVRDETQSSIQNVQSVFQKYYVAEGFIGCYSVIKQISGSQTEDLLLFYLTPDTVDKYALISGHQLDLLQIR